MDENIQNTEIPQKKKNIPLIIVSIIAVLLAVALVLVIVLDKDSGDNEKTDKENKAKSEQIEDDSEEAVQIAWDSCSDVFYKGDVEIDDLLPEEVFEYYAKEVYETDDIDDFIADCETRYRFAYKSDYIDGCGGFQVDSVELQDIKQVSDEELEEIASCVYDQYKIPTSDVEKAYEFEADGLVCFWEGVTEYSGDVYYAVKIRDNWYLMRDYGDVYEFSGTNVLSYYEPIG